MAIVLTARTWLRLNEPHLQALQRRLGEEEARRRAKEYEERNGFGAAAEQRLIGAGGAQRRKQRNPLRGSAAATRRPGTSRSADRAMSR